MPGTQSDAAGRVVALAVGLTRQHVALSADLAATSGMAPSDVKALQALDAAAEGPGVPMGVLAARLGLSPGAVTSLVDRLESHGLALRQRDPVDRRRVHVVLGPRAREFGERQLAPVAARLQAAVAALSADELDAVARFLAVWSGAEETGGQP